MAQMNPLSRTLAAHALGQRAGMSLVGGEADEPGAPTLPRADADLYSYIAERGFHYPRELVTRYLLALHSKPFAMFTGTSGTGKTKLALLTAEYFASIPGTRATRWERPQDGDSDFYLPIDRVTLRAGTLTPSRDQLDYFNVPAGSTESFTATITNVLGAHGDITFRATNIVAGGRKHVTIQVPSSVRRAFEETGVTDRDWLRFEIVEEFKRYRVSLFRPQSEEVDVPMHDRYAFVSVRPTWNDHTALLGHYDTTLDRYVRTPVLELLLRAAREERDARAAGRPPAPYFVMLDEMNIAKVEHYFSDFLSALESRRLDAEGSIQQEPLHLHGADAERLVWMDHLGVEYEIPEQLPIPTNVVFTGTLNLDDTTWGLSPKVVDRASTLAFSAVDFAGYLSGEGAAQAQDPLELPAERTRDLQLGDFRLASADDSRAVAEHLQPFIRLNELLVDHDQHYGYRVLNDVALYVRSARDLVGEGPEVLEAAVDSCVLQKILPKFYSWDSDRGGLLTTLLAFCLDGDVDAGGRGLSRDELLARVEVDASDRANHAGGNPARFPRSAGRLTRMLHAMA